MVLGIRRLGVHGAHGDPHRTNLVEDDVQPVLDRSRSSQGIEGERPRGSLRRPPVSRRGLLVWLLAYVVMTGVAILVGFLIVDHLGGVRDLDTRIARWLGDHRTPTWNDLTWVGSGLAESSVKIAATVVLSVVFLWRWRRWTEPALLAGALVLEVMVFITASFVVDRGRPPISQLDSIPPTSSYPSGHTAAAVAFYGAIAIIVVWHTRNRVARSVAIGAAILLPLIVGASRMYRGMHHLSDVAVGAIIGALALWVTYAVVRTGPAFQNEPESVPVVTARSGGLAATSRGEQSPRPTA